MRNSKSPTLRNLSPLLTVNENWADLKRELNARSLAKIQAVENFPSEQYSVTTFSSGGMGEYIRIDDEFYASVNSLMMPEPESFSFIGEDWLRICWMITGAGYHDLVPFGYNRVPASITPQTLAVAPGNISYELYPDNFIKIEGVNANVPLRWVAVAMSRRALQRLLGEMDSFIPQELDRYLSLDDSLLMIRKAPVSNASLSILKSLFDIPLTGHLRYKYLCSQIHSLLYMALGSNWQASGQDAVSGNLHRHVIEAAAMLRQAAKMSDVDLANIPRQFGLSRSRFDHAFYVTFGTTPGRYLMDEKMKRAANLLMAGDKQIKDISAELGYGSPVSFYRAFLRCMGVTPSEFRDQHRRKQHPSASR